MIKILFLLLFTLNVFAGTAQVNNIGRFGGSPNTTEQQLVLPPSNLSSAIQLSANVLSGDSLNNGFMKLVRWSSAGSNQYQVPSSKTFKMLGFYLHTSSSNVNILFGYGTAALASNYTTTAPTGVVYFSASSTSYPIRSDSSATWKYFSLVADFPADSYPFVKNESGGFAYHIVVSGVEI